MTHIASCHPQFIRRVLILLTVGVVSKASALLGRGSRGLKTYTAGDSLSRLPRGGLTFPIVVRVRVLLGLSHGGGRALDATRRFATGRRADVRVGIGGQGRLPLV